jgi:hypothetical protein
VPRRGFELQARATFASMVAERDRLRTQIEDWHTFANGALARERQADGEAERLAAVATADSFQAWTTDE